MNIVLLGYMASGKSKIGKELAKILSYKYKDLDNIIESEENKSIKIIFKDHGELYFRKKEKYYLDALLNTSKNTVVSLGGGTPCYYGTIDLLVNDISLKTVYLRVSIPVLIDRLKNEKSKRPLIANIESDALLKEFIGKHLFERSYYYNKAEVKINGNNSVEAIVEDIILELF